MAPKLSHGSATYGGATGNQIKNSMHIVRSIFSGEVRINAVPFLDCRVHKLEKARNMRAVARVYINFVIAILSADHRST